MSRIPGRGFPICRTERTVPTLDGEPTIQVPKYGQPDPGFHLVSPDGNRFAPKQIRRIPFDLTNTFSVIQIVPGTLFYFSGQSGGTAAPMQVQLGITNDLLDIKFGDVISGVPFDRFTLLNLVAQPGVQAIMTIISDNIKDRVAFVEA